MVVLLQAQDSTIVERDNGLALFGGMGIHLVAAPDIVDYINAKALFSQRVDDFGTGIDFFGGGEVPLSAEWGLKVEHSYLFKSYTFPGRAGETIDFFYAVHAPTLLVQRVYSGFGYFVKIGLGGGYHFGSAEQKVSTFGVRTTYTSSGMGVKAELVGQTAFDEQMFGYIGGSLGWEFLGELKDKSGNTLLFPNTSSGVSLRYFHTGIRFGVTYYL